LFFYNGSGSSAPVLIGSNTGCADTDGDSVCEVTDYPNYFHSISTSEKSTFDTLRATY
jgi:hypothetical protein